MNKVMFVCKKCGEDNTKETQSRIGRSSRSRGHGFERLMAKHLSILLGIKLNRTPASGGHAIKGDLYEAPNDKTQWSSLEMYCRTSESFSFENLLCDTEPVPKPIQWIEETGPNSVWFIRSRPGRVFVMAHVKRFRSPEAWPYLVLGEWLLTDVENLNKCTFFCGDMKGNPSPS